MNITVLPAGKVLRKMTSGCVCISLDQFPQKWTISFTANCIELLRTLTLYCCDQVIGNQFFLPLHFCLLYFTQIYQYNGILLVCVQVYHLKYAVEIYRISRIAIFNSKELNCWSVSNCISQERKRATTEVPVERKRLKFLQMYDWPIINLPMSLTE